MNSEPLDVAIIGAGTAGLSARSEVAKVTERYMVFDPGPYGTTCARTACMPSKALLQSAHDFHRRKRFETMGIIGSGHLAIDGRRVLAETRDLRDSLVDGVLENMDEWRDTHLVECAPIIQPGGLLRAGDKLFQPKATIIASGSRPFVPRKWQKRLSDRVLTSEEIFELTDLPRRMAVVGLGPVGLELGQAFARLGVEVIGFDPAPSIGGLEDPELLQVLHDALSSEMTIVAAEAELEDVDGRAIRVSWDEDETVVDLVLVAMGRRPNIDDLGLHNLGVEADSKGRVELPQNKLSLPEKGLYFAGDVSGGPAILHEASDEGRIAGYFAARGEEAVFDRRVPLRIVFCEPQIALAGASWKELEVRKEEIAKGEASLENSGRTQLQRAQGGAIHIYAEKATARVVGAAILAPEAEHLAHLIAYAIGKGDDLRSLLQMPVYHPTHEEVLRRALRSALRSCEIDATDLDAIRCEDAPVDRDGILN